MKKLIIAALAANLVVGTASAANSQSTDPTALRVSTAGLDLSNPRDIATLQARVDKAVEAACSPHGSYFSQLAPKRDCLAQLSAHTNRILASRINKADKSRMAEF